MSQHLDNHDDQMGCENTAEATLAGLAAGMTAVELDISMSQDKVTRDSDDSIIWWNFLRYYVYDW